jgi:aminoglycoside phosphotransferase (APT) family kinase protein
MAGDPTTRWEIPLKNPGRDPGDLRRALTDWLVPRLGASPLQLSALHTPPVSGVSNETYLFEARGHTVRYALVARVQTGDPLYLEAAVERQFLTYRALADADGVAVPAVVGYEADPAVLGAPFFVMERVPGDIPGSNPHFTRKGWLYDATPAQRRAAWRSAVEQLVAMHRVDTADLTFLDRGEPGKSALERELNHWRAAYRWAAGAATFPVLEAAEEWLLANLPADQMPALSWGDARLENLVFDDFRCVAVLDFETTSLAGPASDLAWWALMDKGSDVLAGLGSPQETIDLYRRLTGAEVPDLKYHLVLCAFRLSAVYIRLAALLRARDALPPGQAGLAENNEKVQQLALLLGLAAPAEVDATLPHLDLD